MSPRAIFFAGAAVVLFWLVVTHSLVAFLADAAPQEAVWIDPHQPDALANLAEQAIRSATVAPAKDAPGPERPAGASTNYAQNFTDAFARFESISHDLSISRPLAPANQAAVSQWAITALTNDPLNARALQILGQLAIADGNDPKASIFMHAVVQLSLHDSNATFWLLQNSMKVNDYKSAIYYADVMLRTDPRSLVYVMPALAQISQDNNGISVMENALAADPPWRSDFIAALPNYVTDARTPLNLLLALRKKSVPLTAEDLEPYVDLLLAHKFYGLAYYTWLQFLPPEELRHAGLLFNGNFEQPPSGLPFNWTIKQGAGVTVDIVPNPDKKGEHALLVDFQYGRVDYHSVTQLVMLAPGSYVFSGEYKGQLVGPRGMTWRVVCAEGKVTTGGESPMITGIAKGWKTVSFTFAVPDTGCTAQYVRLDLDARWASEQLISGSILFDHLQILRSVNSSTAGG